MSTSLESTTWQRVLTARSTDDERSPGDRRSRAAAETWLLEGWGPVVVRLSMGAEVSLNLLTARDDCTRALLGLAAGTAEGPASAERLWRDTAVRWGLPRRLCCDRHSAYLEPTFLACLQRFGYHRA